MDFALLIDGAQADVGCGIFVAVGHNKLAVAGDVAAFDLNARLEIARGFFELNCDAAISSENWGQVVGQKVCREVVRFVVLACKFQAD